MIWAASWQNQQNDCVLSEYCDQTWQMPRLIGVFALRMKKAWALSYPLSAQRRLWSDWVGFVTRRLIYNVLLLLRCHGTGIHILHLYRHNVFYLQLSHVLHLGNEKIRKFQRWCFMIFKVAPRAHESYYQFTLSHFLGRLKPLKFQSGESLQSAHTFAINWQLPFLIWQDCVYMVLHFYTSSI